MKVGDLIAVDLPSEPRVGTKVRDVTGDVWEHVSNGWRIDGDNPRNHLTWRGLLIHWAPLTVVTAPPPMPEPPEESLVRHAGRIFGRLPVARPTGPECWRLIRGADSPWWTTWEKLLALDPNADPEILEL